MLKTLVWRGRHLIRLHPLPAFYLAFGTLWTVVFGSVARWYDWVVGAVVFMILLALSVVAARKRRERGLAQIAAVYPPKNVRYVCPNGRTIPVECVFMGYDVQGNAVWRATTPMPYNARFAADIVPPRTRIDADIKGPPGFL